MAWTRTMILQILATLYALEDINVCQLVILEKKWEYLRSLLDTSDRLSDVRGILAALNHVGRSQEWQNSLQQAIQQVAEAEENTDARMTDTVIKIIQCLGQIWADVENGLASLP